MKKKGILAIAVVASLLGAMLTGCGNGNQASSSSSGNVVQEGPSLSETTETEGNDETYEATLLYLVSNDSAPDIQLVENAFNELTMKELNIKVDLLPMSFSTYNQQLQLMLSSGEKLDLFPMGANVANTYVNAQFVVNLADYLDKAPDVVAKMGMDDIMCCSTGDTIWGFPVMAERAHPTGFVMREDILNQVGYQVEDIKSLDDMTRVFDAVHREYPDMTVLGGQYSCSLGWLSNHIDPLGDRFGVLDSYGDSTTVVNYYETEGFRELVERMREWYMAGYVSKDLPTSIDSANSIMRAGNTFAYCNNVKPDTETETEASTGQDIAIYQYNEDFLTTWGTSTFGFAVANNSENPAKAVELYNWIYTSQEANDLLNWGVEGVHWVEAEDGTAAYPEGIDINSVGYHQGYGWCMPNQQAGHVWNGGSSDIWEEYTKVRNEAKMSPAYGFSFDITSVANEIAALTATQEQYVYTLSSGAVDPETGIKQLNDALYAAGLQKVMDEKQKQLDEWLANQD